MEPLPISITLDPFYLTFVGILLLFLIIWGIYSMILSYKEYKLHKWEVLSQDNDPTGFTASGDTKEMPLVRSFRKGNMKYE